MRYFKVLVAVTIALSAVLLSLHGLSQAAEVDTPAPDRFRRPIVNPSNNLTSTSPVTVQLWLMPDFEEGRVWVNGQVIGADWPPIPLKNDGMQSPIWTAAGNRHFFGWWEGSQVISIGRRLEGAYEICLPGLDLKPEDVLDVRLVSGIILTNTLSPQSAGPISRTLTETGTLGIALDLALPTASSALTATVLTGTYTLTGLEATPPSGEFAVSPTVTLTANYTLPASAPLSATGNLTPTVLTTTLPFSYTVSTFGEFSQLELRNFSRAVTLTVPFYPFEKAIDLTLTPLLLETVMTHTASATGGNVFHKLAGATYGDGRTIQYAQAGLMGRGDVRLRIRTVEGDRERSAMALVTSFRKYREEMDRAGANQWRGGLGRLLERHLDFPSFPSRNSLGELQRHKHTIVHVLTRDLSYTVQDDLPALTLEAPFQLQVWRVRDWAVMGWGRVRREQSDERVRAPIYHSPQRPVLEEYAFTDFNLLAEDGEVLQMRLGRVMLGPQDVLTLTLESADWLSLDPLPDELVDLSREGGSGPDGGFTAVYRGPRSFWLDLRYTPHPALFTRQSAAMVRGLSRIYEDQLRELYRWAWELSLRNRLPIFRSSVFPVLFAAVALLLIIWIPYQLAIPGQRCPDWLCRLLRTLDRKRGTPTPDEDRAPSSDGEPDEAEGDQDQGIAVCLRQFWKRAARLLKAIWPVCSRFMLMLVYLALLLAMAKGSAWAMVVHALGDSIPAPWREAPLPFSVLMVSGSLLLLRLDTVLYRRGWLLVLVVAPLSFIGDVWLNSQYSRGIQNALNFSSASGILSGATSMAVLFEALCFVGMLFWWGLHKDPLRRLQHEDLYAFAFAALAAATFEVTDVSLFAIAVLFIAWFILSLLLDAARPLEECGQREGPAHTPLESPSDEAQPSKSEEPSEEEPSDKPASNGDGSGAPESIRDKLTRFRNPLPLGAILATAIFLSQDPLLRAQLASFAQSALLQNTWTIWLDPIARLATTLVPCVAIAILMVLLDTSLERLRGRRVGLDTFLKVIPLAAVLFGIFMLGIGGLFLFTGALELELSDRIVYYVTVPLLTGIWLDWQLPDKELNWTVLWDNLKKNLGQVKNWIASALALLSILAPRLVSQVTTDEINAIITALQDLRF